MAKKTLTREYIETVRDVYKEKGFLAAVGYEINSTLYSLSTRIANIFAHVSGGGVYGSTESHEMADRDVGAISEERKSYMLRGRKQNKLEQTAAVTSMTGLLGAIFIFSSNFTGNVIGNSETSNSNWVGWALFIIGLFGAFAYFKKK